jgi:hypothetical protein
MTRFRAIVRCAVVVAVATGLAGCGEARTSTAPDAPVKAPSQAELIVLDAPDQVAPGAEFSIAWSGPVKAGDYLTIVAPGATRVANGAAYIYLTGGSPGTLVAPTESGDYEIWLVEDDTRGDLAQYIRARRALKVSGEGVVRSSVGPSRV